MERYTERDRSDELPLDGRSVEAHLARQVEERTKAGERLMFDVGGDGGVRLHRRRIDDDGAAGHYTHPGDIDQCLGEHRLVG